ncbi:MAG: hypothetical protein JW801_18235 [Bacteroidales bacterium]|nr:hypothetical protein [Bacteroidales bacterium]
MFSAVQWNVGRIISTKYYEFGINPMQLGEPIIYLEDYKIGAKQAGLPDDDSPCVGTYDCFAKIDCDASDTYGEWD